MRALFLAGVVLTLSACGGDRATTNTTTTNMTATDNMSMGQGGMTDPAMNGAGGMSGTMNGSMGTMNGSMPIDPTTANMIRQDMNTNSPDTNLANGM